MLKSRKKFRGWVLPEKFVPHFHHVHNKRHSAFVGPLNGLRQPAHVVRKPTKEKEVYLEKIVYVGCVHGGSGEIYKRLNLLAKNPPDYLIFTGDVTGSAEIERLKRHFYECKGANSPQPPLSLRGGKRDFEYFGEWVATLPKEKRLVLLSGLKQSSQQLLEIITKIKKRGTKIFIVEGNWDNPQISGINAIAGEDIQNVFDTESFFKSRGFPFINQLTTIETKTTLQILLPYVALLHFEDIGKSRLDNIIKQIIEAKNKGKAIIMVGHAEANWRIHHLNQKNESQIGKERRVVITNFGRVMALFAPDEVIYPHQHARIRDESGKLVNIDTKYFLEVKHDGVRLVDDPNSLTTDNRQIIATYIPFGFLAEEDFVLD